MFESAYATLRISRDATPEAARQAYLRMVRRYPPEHFPDKFAEIRNAYRQLTLDDSSLDETREAMFRATPPELAGFLWGDRPEFSPADLVDLNNLKGLASASESGEKLAQILRETAETPFELRGIANEDMKNGALR